MFWLSVSWEQGSRVVRELEIMNTGNGKKSRGKQKPSLKDKWSTPFRHPTPTPQKIHIYPGIYARIKKKFQLFIFNFNNLNE